LQARVLAAGDQEAAANIKPTGLAREDGAEVEAEPVDVGLLHPVAKAIHDHLQHPWMRQVDGVSGARVVDVIAPIVSLRPVIAGIVDAPERQGSALLVALGGVVVDHVEDHLEAGVVITRHHLLELAQGIRSVRSVARIGRKEADRVVAPVVPKTFLEQVAVVQEGMDRQQLHRRHPQGFDVVDDRLLRHPCVGATQRLGDTGVALGKALDVGLVNQGFFPGRKVLPGRAAPIEIRIDHHAFRHEGCAVPFVETQVFFLGADGVAIAGVVPLHRPGVASGVGVEQQLVGIEPVAGLRLVGAVHPIAIDLAGLDAFDIAVENLVGVVRQGDAADLLAPFGVEQAELDAGRVGGEQGEIHAPTVEAGAEGAVRSGAHGEGGRHATSLMHGA